MKTVNDVKSVVCVNDIFGKQSKEKLLTFIEQFHPMDSEKVHFTGRPRIFFHPNWLSLCCFQLWNIFSWLVKATKISWNFFSAQFVSNNAWIFFEISNFDTGELSYTSDSHQMWKIRFRSMNSPQLTHQFCR